MVPPTGPRLFIIPRSSSDATPVYETPPLFDSYGVLSPSTLYPPPDTAGSSGGAARKLTNDEYNWVQRHYHDSKPRLLVELFEKQFGRWIRRQDMYNTIGSIRRIERRGYTDFQRFICELEQGPDIKCFDVDYIQGPDQNQEVSLLFVGIQQPSRALEALSKLLFNRRYISHQ